MAKKRKKSNFIIQGSILAMAGILVRIIGLVYRVWLNKILGNAGISAYSTAYDVYSLFLLISSLSLPLAVSKIVSTRVAKRQMRNAYFAFIGAMILSAVLGLIVAAGVYFGADWLMSGNFRRRRWQSRCLRPRCLLCVYWECSEAFFRDLEQ